MCCKLSPVKLKTALVYWAWAVTKTKKWTLCVMRPPQVSTQPELLDWHKASQLVNHFFLLQKFTSISFSERMISQKKTIQLIVKLYVNLQVLDMLIPAVASVHIVTIFLYCAWAVNKTKKMVTMCTEDTAGIIMTRTCRLT